MLEGVVHGGGGGSVGPGCGSTRRPGAGGRRAGLPLLRGGPGGSSSAATAGGSQLPALPGSLRRRRFRAGAPPARPGPPQPGPAMAAPPPGALRGAAVSVWCWVQPEMGLEGTAVVLSSRNNRNSGEAVQAKSDLYSLKKPDENSKIAPVSGGPKFFLCNTMAHAK